jgi:hypothetical protein
MKKILSTIALLLFVTSSIVPAAGTTKTTSIQDLVDKLATAYAIRDLGSLDADRPYRGSVRIVIEHSLAEDDSPDRFAIKSFKSLAAAQKWLISRETPNEGTPLPIPESRPLEKCRKGVCTFNFDGGILHNHLYLKKVTYGISGGSAYIKSIYLLDGD